MKREELKVIIERYHRGTLSEEEFHLLQAYLSENDSDSELIELWDEVFVSDQKDRLPDLESSKLFANILNDDRMETEIPRSRFLSKTWVVAIAAAAACLLLIFGVKHDGLRSVTERPAVQSAMLILPGSNKALLELDNGEVLDLEEIKIDSLIVFEGFSVRKLANGSLQYIAQGSPGPKLSRYNTLVTPPGGEYKLVLPDGSKVALNASSRLRYPVRFEPGMREVELSGEAYFEVTKQVVNGKRVPFIVETGTQKLEVLGTEFNIRNYGENIETTLVEGAVRVSYPSEESYILKPNQQSVYQKKEKSVRIASVDPFYITAWKDGSFAFNNAGIKDVMDEIARWYDVEMVYAENLDSVKFSGTISKFEDIDKLLNTIAMTGAVNFQAEGRRIMVSK